MKSGFSSSTFSPGGVGSMLFKAHTDHLLEDVSWPEALADQNSPHTSSVGFVVIANRSTATSVL